MNDKSNAPRLITALISSGEAIGDLGGQLKRLASDLETRAKLRREIVGNLIYPAALFILIVLTMMFMSFVVLPQFETVFENTNTPPPAETKFVLSVGGFIRNWWSVIAISLVLSFVPARYLVRRYEIAWNKFIINVPVIGRSIFLANTARFCRSLGSLLCGGLPMAQALPIAREAIFTSVLRYRLERAEHDVRSGSALAAALRRHEAITMDALDLIEIGEKTGYLGKMVLRGADFAEDKLTSALKKIAALAGPIMTAIMGILTAGVIAAIMAGVMSLNEIAY